MKPTDKALLFNGEKPGLIPSVRYQLMHKRPSQVGRRTSTQEGYMWATAVAVVSLLGFWFIVGWIILCFIRRGTC